MPGLVVPPPEVLPGKKVGTLDGTLTSVWSNGQGSSSEVPFPFFVSINGHNYLEDFEFKPWKRQAFRATTDAQNRNQSDTSNEPGEQSLSTESPWRRTQDSWHLGAGQVFLDRKNSQEFAFRQSKGINVWTEWQMTLLNDVTESLISTNDNLDLVTCGGHMYVIDGKLLKYTPDGVTWTTVTGTPNDTASSICTDGHNVWVAYGNGGVYSTTEGAATASQYVSSAVLTTAVVRFVMGRLMVGSGNALYNITGSGALPAALLQSTYGDLVWNDLTPGNGVIFACGNSGNIGVVYSMQITTDGTSLSSPILVGQLPNGENINCIQGYGGSAVMLGTSLGWRLAEQALANEFTGTVALNIGPLTTAVNGFDSPVTCLAAYDRFIYGSYSDYDTVSTGLFRSDLTQFLADLAPAWATDLMAPTQGTVSSVTFFDGNPAFSVSGVGVFVQAATYVASGTIDSGFITYALVDNKMPCFVDNQLLPLSLGCSLQSLVSLDSGSFVSVGTLSQAGVGFVEFNAPQTLSQTLEIRQILTSNAAHTSTPTLLRHTMRALPNPPVPTDWTVVIQMRERIKIQSGIELPMVPSQEYGYLDGLRQQKTLCTLQVGNFGPYTVTIEQIDYIPEQRGSVLSGEVSGVAVLTCRTLA